MAIPKHFFLCLCVFILSSCNKDTVGIQVHVKDDSGRSLADASVLLNGNEIGKTTSSGLFAASLALKKGEHRIEISKETDNSKYVPYKQDILYYRDEDQKINIEATLYSAPKFSFQQKATQADDFPTLTPVKKEQEHAAEPKQASKTQASPTTKLVEEKTPPPVIAKKAVETTKTPSTTKPTKTNSKTKNLSNLEEVDRLLIIGKIPEALKILKSIPSTSPEFIHSWQKIGEINLSLLDNPKEALAAYNKLTRLPTLKNYNNPKHLKIYVDKAIAYFDLGELKATTHKKEANLMYRNTYWITQRIQNLANTGPDDAALVETIHYYKALALHRTWQLHPNKQLRAKVNKEWLAYQAVAKKQKTHKHESFLANSAIFLKETL